MRDASDKSGARRSRRTGLLGGGHALPRLRHVISAGAAAALLTIPGALCVAAQSPAETRTIAGVSNAIAAGQRITVTATLMLESEPGYLFVHDDTGDLRVHVRGTNALPAQRGDRIAVSGLPVLMESRPWLEAAEVTRLGEG
jgi:hypothetical protein